MTAVVAVGVVITDADGRVVLVQRGKDPQRGRWSVPGGSVEAGEGLQEAAAREAWEETGLRVEIGAELGQFHSPTADGREFRIHDFAATVIGGELRAGDDADDARWVHLHDLESLPLTVGLMGFLRQSGVLGELPPIVAERRSHGNSG